MSQNKDQTFATFDFDARLSKAIAQLDYTRPTPVQAQAIPLALAGKDILARARTGSGKTAAYVLPILQKILVEKESLNATPSIKALILVPTRELAEQVTTHINKFLLYTNQLIKVINLAGTMSVQLQRPLLAEKPDIIVSTPSKALTHLEAGNMALSASLTNLVIDEADLVLSFGYEDDLRKILSHLPKLYQCFLMSATFTKEIEELTTLLLRKPAVLELEDTEEEASLLTQYIVQCTEFEKFLFTFVIIKLRVAAVVNFDFPASSKAYTHRVGRTARGGNQGMSLSFVVTKDLVEDRKDVGRGKGVHDEAVYERVKKQQEAKNAELKPYSFEKKNVSGFKYRVEDALKAVNKVAIKEARIKEIKQEILNSEKLKAHFEDKPKDLEFLRHDHTLQPAKIQQHLKHIPSYLMPRITVPTAMANAGENVPFHNEKRKRKGHFKPNHNNKKRKDPLKSIRRR
ncbi:Putative ATP-dependent RNA helicase DBP9 [Rhizopus microsporus]|nr:Putative ATP-dependent RNA helicase DBP9 [Rhizopus microsporus]